MSLILKAHAEDLFSEELQELQKQDKEQRPPNWNLSPQAVVSYLMGCKLKNGLEIKPKYIGSKRLMEIAVATLATDRSLLLYGVPGTAKSWVSEHISAAICGSCTLLVQGTAGTSEDAIRYSWNYAMLLAKGPSREALVPSPVMKAMEQGKIARIEELTRMPSDVQDALITILSEKTLPVTELNAEVQASKGFNIIATANNKDRGVNEISSALKRRFNTVILPVPSSLAEEMKIVENRVKSLGHTLELPSTAPALDEIKKVVTIFRELREGVTLDGKMKIKQPTGTMSVAEAISVMSNAWALSAHFGNGKLKSQDIAASILGAVVKDPVQDTIIWKEYLETVVKNRDGWQDL